ncbi:hypothetical protein WICMUC_001750 [Wickerhamomyces mucosus]|uniref:tRNA-splicing endonuclease subunit Sen2 n=1 Tax=Wickerhamomyces mucosus TaxID=1378264 RepID=A0A9P8PT38_9ASCO|nr:hypothetical protein WICMUC_001750 [Wickerhamomyces mucosus]
MVKRKPLKEVYKWLLPQHPLPLPEIIPHNPISWFFFAYSYIIWSIEINTACIKLHNGLFLVEDPTDIKSLWHDGFFGKGIFSRSESTWYERTQKRLGLGIFKNLTREEITALRRDERKKFKKERAILEAKQAELKKKGIVDPFLKETLDLKTLRDKDLDTNTKRETFIRKEDEFLVENGILKNIEYAELQPVEVFFLKFALNCVSISTPTCEDLSAESLLDILSNGLASDPFILNYVIYHYYRSSGWCVRSGIKFGTDYILYKRGPPFSHAEYAVLLVPQFKDQANDGPNFVELSGLNRIVGAVRKKLVLTFVEIPSQEEFDKARNIKDLLELYNIREFLYRRWVPNKNRD